MGDAEKQRAYHCVVWAKLLCYALGRPRDARDYITHLMLMLGGLFGFIVAAERSLPGLTN